MTSGAGRVCVTGSLMLDIVMRVARRPGAGETVASEGFGMFLGGKGFNQAVAAHRLGAEVALVGRVGDDPFGARFRDKLRDESIDSSGLVNDTDEGTGIATPVIDREGQNSIIIAPRANSRVTATDVEGARVLIERSSVLLLQLEIPPEASLAAARIARAAGRAVILNPAPALPVPDELLRAADFLTPNEVEAAALTGMPVTDIDSAFRAAESICARAGGGGTVVVTLGGLGCVALGPDLRLHLVGHPVAVVDTTAAGDAFNGALAATLAAGGTIADALIWANAAGACATRRAGAEPSLPTRDEVTVLLM